MGQISVKKLKENEKILGEARFLERTRDHRDKVWVEGQRENEVFGGVGNPG